MKHTLSKRGKLFVAIIFAFAFCLIGAISSVYVNSFAKGSNGVSLSTSDGALLSATGEDVFYIDPEAKYGGSDDNSGLSPDTPIQSYQKASEIVSPTSVVYVMSTCYITEDTVIDLIYPTVELRRYQPEDPTIFQDEDWYIETVEIFEGHIFVVGSESDSNISLSVSFDNITFNGEKFDLSDNQDERGSTFSIRVYNSNVFLGGGLSFIDFRTRYSPLGGRNSYVVINGSKIISKSGGSAPIDMVGSTIVINDILMERCSSSNGAIIGLYGNGCKAIVNDGVFSGPLTSSSFREVFYCEGNSDIIINGGEFFNYKNHTIFRMGWAPGNGGYNTNLIINGGYFHDNSINNNVNDYDVNSPSWSLIISGGNVVINGGVFENNSNVNAGGVINLYQGNLTINGGVFRNNTAACGGVIYCNLPQDTNKTRRANIVIRNAEFTGNSVVNSTDNVFVTPEKFDCDINGTLFGGSAIFTTQNITIDNCIFKGNTLEVSQDVSSIDELMGGGIVTVLSEGTQTIANITNTDFLENNLLGSSSEGKSIIYCRQDDTYQAFLRVKNCDFYDNSVEGYGCYLVKFAINRGELIDCRFFNNNSRYQGYLVYSGRYYINCEFRKNINFSGVFTYSSLMKDCLWEENVAHTPSVIFAVGGYNFIEDCTIKNNVTISKTHPEQGGILGSTYSPNIYLIGRVYIYGNRYNAELDEDGYPLIENGELVGGEELNIMKRKANMPDDTDFTNIYSFGLDTKNSKIGIWCPHEDQNSDILNGIEPAVYLWGGSPVNSDILNCLVSDDPDYEFELRDGDIYLKKITNEGEIVYTASDEITPYDGQSHNINVNVISPNNAKVRYKLNESDNYTDQAPELINVGSYTVYYEITAGGYSTVTGSRKVEITQNTTGLVDYVPNKNNIDAPITTVHLYYGETLAVGTDLTGRIGAGAIKDQNGNSVAGTFTANGTYNVTFATNRIHVKFTPTNPSYSECTFWAEVTFEYEDLYFINGSFYTGIDSNQQGTGFTIPRSVGLNKVISYMKPNSTIYFFDTYEITTDETLAVEKPITLSRYKFSRQVSTGTTETVVFTEEILNISSAGSLFIGGINATDKTSSLSKIIIDGQGYATLGSLKPLIVNNGDLRITGNLEIKGGYNTNESASGALAPGGAIYNTGKLFWVNVLISDCRYLNYVANISQFGAGGGAIYNTGTLDLINGSIQNCLARGGGAIYSSGTLSIDSLRFMGNNSSSRTMLGSETHAGHTIKLVGGKANISNTVITSSSISNGTTTGNQNSSEMVVDKIGGAIYVGKDAELFLSDTNISKCYAYQGGGLYVDGKVYMFSVVITSCSTKNGGQGIAVGTLGKLVAINLHIARCTTTSTPDSSVGTTEKGVLTLNGGSSSLLSLSYDGDEISSSSIDNTNNDYIFGVVLSVVVLGVFVAIGLVLNARKKGAKISLKSKRN